MAQFSVYNNSVESIINWIISKEVAIPEIQRPFVWDATRVRDLIDSLYNGFPVGYIITWKNPDIKLKDGTISQGRKILIDGQQRITALQAAIAGEEIVNSNYQKRRIKIAFNPLKEVFEVSNTAIQKDVKWIDDISKVFRWDFSAFSFINNYCSVNDINGQQDYIARVLQKLQSIKAVNLGVIELNSALSIEDVTEIFIRINSKGVVLSQADFAMSKISSDDKFCGNKIRKMIDYFCHLIRVPNDYPIILKNDTSFATSELNKNIQWVLNKQDDIYVPNYTDVLRVAFTHKFLRGRLSDLVSLLSGRDFDTRENLESVAEDSFMKLKEGTEAFINETNFKRYLMILHSAGIIDVALTRSQNVLNFGYIIYLALKDKMVNSAHIENIVRRWVILSMLTSRYSGSPESIIEYDIKRFTEQDPMTYLKSIEAGELSDAFWRNTLITKLNTTVRNSPSFIVFLIAQIKQNAKGFLSKNITVRSLIEQKGDIHHLFPKNYLQKNGYNTKKDYNQVANYVYTQSEINNKISNNSPAIYMKNMQNQISTCENIYGEISTYKDLLDNLCENCIPEEFMSMNADSYEKFLEIRRSLMANYIKEYYQSLK